MNNLKKIGLSALAGSLVAVSAAQAGDLGVTGGLTATYATKDGSAADGAGNHGKGFATATDLTFSGSTELDNGWTVSGFVTQVATMGSISSSQLTIGMGSMGKLVVNKVGGGAVNAMDDKLPTAYEEASDNVNHDFIGENVGSTNNGGSLSYYLPTLELEGVSLSIGVDYDPASGVDSGGPGSTQIASTYGAGTGLAIGIGTDYGFNAYVAVDDNERLVTSATAGAITKDEFNGTAGASYAAGPVTIGYQTWYNDAGAGVHYESDGMSVAFAVNENLSVSYATIDETKYAAGLRSQTNVEANMKAINIAYSMGAIGVKAHHSTTDNPDFTANTDGAMSEIAVSFAF